MRYFRFNKLVRDRIVEHMKKNNQIAYGVRKLNNQEYKQELIKKIKEETEELELAESDEQFKEELADLQEVIDCLKNSVNLSEKELLIQQQQKSEKNGGFQKKLYIDYMGLEDEDSWLDYFLTQPHKYPEITEEL